ncbi:MAG: ABC transporter permease [Candidatus Bathyarchaeia archaeon]
MNIADELEGLIYIVHKDLKAYYFKPPNISWGILFPIVLALSFTLRNPTGLEDLAPGLIAMSALFGTTSMEAIVITFEKRVGALERLLLAPINLRTILWSKILGGSIFGIVISAIMTAISLIFLEASINSPILFILVMLFTVIVHSALGALVAVSVKEVFEAQTLSNYFRFPMIFLCGVFIPLYSMPEPIRYVARLLPLTYSVEALRLIMNSMNIKIMVIDLVALLIFIVALSTISLRLLKKNLE